MPFKRVYYETEPFAFYFFNKREEKDYSPFRKEIEGVISLFVEEEFLHQMMKGGWRKWVKNKEHTFLDIWEDFEKRKHIYDIPDLSTTALSRKYKEILSLFRKNFREEMSDHSPHQMDLLHVASAELTKSKKFLVLDTDFRIFEQIEGADKIFDSLKEIEILNYDKNTTKFTDSETISLS